VRDFQDKNRNGVMKRILYSPFGIGFLGLVVLFFAWGVVNFLLTMKETVKNRNIAQQKVLELEKRKEKLVKDIDDLNTDKGKEKVFREDFGMGRDGEGLVIVVEEKKNVLSNEEEAKKDLFPSIGSFFSRLLENN